MKIKRIQIVNQNKQTVYKGQIIGLKFIKDFVVEKCVELFNDDKPCVIHESYAIQHLAEIVEKLWISKKQTSFLLDQDFLNLTPELDLTKYVGMHLFMEVKK